jgi:DNA processing protein
VQAELAYWLAFIRVLGVGPNRLRRLEDHFGNLAAAWAAGPAEWTAAGLEPKVAEGIAQRRRTIDPDQELHRLEASGFRAITWNDPEYSERLREIYAPPPVLFVRGELERGDPPTIAVVGTRTPTAYGREVARRIAGELAANGITVVSGLARGIDAIAHRAALDAGGRTVAVLGSGVDVIYPSEHTRLADMIAGAGAVISEYPLGTKPDAGNFPQRNRVISGLSQGVLVVEAGEASGALITVRYALDQNRDVYAVPGSILSPQSRGTNRLIKEGAKLVNEVGDILEELNLVEVGRQLALDLPPPENELEARLLKLLSAEPVHVDEVGRGIGLPIQAVSSTLTLMELKGMVRHVGGMNYVRARER